MITGSKFRQRSAVGIAAALSLVLPFLESQAVAQSATATMPKMQAARLSEHMTADQAAATPSARPFQHFRSPTAKYPFSDAVQAGDFLFVAGQIGQGQGSFEVAARDALDRISRILVAHGSNMDNVVHCTVMLQDIRLWSLFNQIYAGYFKPERLPARSAFGVTALANNAPLEVECFAYNPPPKL